MELAKAVKFEHVGYDNRWYVSATPNEAGDFHIVVRDTVALRDVEELLVSSAERDKTFDAVCQRWSLK